MTDFLNNMGKKGVVNMFAEETGEAVKGIVKNVMGETGGGAEGEGGDKKEGGAGKMVGTVIKAMIGGEDENEGGAGNMMNTLMNTVTGGEDEKEGGGGGLDMSKVVGGLFNS